jgi:hypothetical protein
VATTSCAIRAISYNTHTSPRRGYSIGSGPGSYSHGLHPGPLGQGDSCISMHTHYVLWLGPMPIGAQKAFIPGPNG